MADVTLASNNAPPDDSHLFMVRVWLQTSTNGEMEWYGKIQHVLTGNVRYFRDWATFVAFMQQTLSETPSNEKSDTLFTNGGHP